jgi:hypothetical protein
MDSPPGLHKRHFSAVDKPIDLNAVPRRWDYPYVANRVAASAVNLICFIFMY